LKYRLFISVSIHLVGEHVKMVDGEKSPTFNNIDLILIVYLMIGRRTHTDNCVDIIDIIIINIIKYNIIIINMIIKCYNNYNVIPN